MGIEKNTALAENRANTVVSWLTNDARLQDVRTVTDPSTRGLNAKLNRCVKVRIRYLIK